MKIYAECCCCFATFRILILDSVLEENECVDELCFEYNFELEYPDFPAYSKETEIKVN